MDQELITRYARASELIKDGMARQAALGKPQGPAPLGYRNVRYGGVKTVETADPETVRLIQEAFALAASGLPLRKVLAKMTERGLRSRHGKPLGTSALWGILTNPFYCGLMRLNGALIPGRHVAIIERKAFGEAQDRLQNHRKNFGTPPVKTS